MGVSQQEFAKIRGITQSRVAQLKSKGFLVLDVDGKIDVESSNRNLDERPNNYRGGPVKQPNNPKPVADKPSKENELADRARELVDSGAVERLTHAEAVTVKENYLARLRELEYLEKSGAVVDVSEICQAVADEYGSIRNRLLSIPSEIAPRIAILSSAEECRDMLEDEINKALEGLTVDRRYSSPA